MKYGKKIFVIKPKYCDGEDYYDDSGYLIMAIFFNQ